MSKHHEFLINIPIALAAIFFNYWMPVFESGSWLAGKLIPYLGLIAVILQIWLYVRKLRRK